MTCYYAGQAYNADIAVNGKDLTLCYNILYVFKMLGALLGAFYVIHQRKKNMQAGTFVTSLFSDKVGAMNWIAIASTINTLCFFYALFFLPHLRPTDVKMALGQGKNL